MCLKEASPSNRVLLMTGYPGSTVRLEDSVGAQDLLLKPLGIEHLSEVVYQAIH